MIVIKSCRIVLDVYSSSFKVLLSGREFRFQKSFFGNGIDFVLLDLWDSSRSENCVDTSSWIVLNIVQNGFLILVTIREKSQLFDEQC